MEPNNGQQEQHRTAECGALHVMALGFGALAEEKFNALFRIDRPHSRAYTLAHPGGPVDILLVNYDIPAALHEKDRVLGSHPAAQLVAVSHGPLDNPPAHHLRGMMTAARLLGVLDKVQCAEPALAPVTSAATPQINPASPVAPPPSAPVTPHPVAAQPKADGYSVLVVDDSIAIQKSIELKLATLEQIAVIDCADSGESALEKAALTQYDLIFLDVMMPGIDGYETCIQLRKKAEYKKTPIIMVSGKTSPLDEVKGVMAGCTTYLTKPVKDEAFNKLSLRILAWLANRKPLASNA
jgi:CheY-like chemotaxis protein